MGKGNHGVHSRVIDKHLGRRVGQLFEHGVQTGVLGDRLDLYTNWVDLGKGGRHGLDGCCSSCGTCFRRLGCCCSGP